MQSIYWYFPNTRVSTILDELGLQQMIIFFTVYHFLN